MFSRLSILISILILLSLHMIHAQDDIPTTPSRETPLFTGSTKPIIQENGYLILKKRINLNPLMEDDNILRFVSKTRPLKNKGYTPPDLVPIAGSGIDQAGRTGYLRREARLSLGDLAQRFEEEFGTPLIVISGYRSANYQQRMWDLGKCTDSLCAPPGHSEHQLGLAIDLFDATTKAEYLSNPRYRSYITWLRKYGPIYGWTESYTRGEALDEYEAEPWHWRYVGREMALRLKKLGWNYTEYIRFQEAIQSQF